MPKIGRLPPFCKRLFRRTWKMVGSCRFSHNWRAVIGLAAMKGRRSAKKLERGCRNHRIRQSIGFFLSKAEWGAPALLTEKAMTAQYLGLDDYQMLRFRGIERYLHLLLTHLGASVPGAKAEHYRGQPLAFHSVLQLRVLREKLWDDTIESMETGKRNRRFGKKLKQINVLDTW